MHARSFLRLSLFGIIVSSVIICRLPENGVPNGIRTIHDPEGSSSSSTPAEDGPDLELESHPCEDGTGTDDALTHSFYPNPNMPRKTGWAQSQVMRLLRVGCSMGKDRGFRVFRFRGRGSVGLLLCSCVDFGEFIPGDS